MKRKTCPSCGKGELINVDDLASEIEGHFFVESGERCSRCGEEFVSEKQGQKVIDVARRLGLWGEPLKLHRKLSKSARGTILRIPVDIEKSMHLTGNEEVMISRIGRNRLLIELLDAG
jgi:ribosomal protein S27AE